MKLARRDLSAEVADQKQQIAQHALTILVNLAADGDVLKALANDDIFLGVIFSRITVRIPKISMLGWGRPRLRYLLD